MVTTVSLTVKHLNSSVPSSDVSVLDFMEIKMGSDFSFSLRGATSVVERLPFLTIRFMNKICRQKLLRLSYHNSVPEQANNGRAASDH